MKTACSMCNLSLAGLGAPLHTIEVPTQEPRSEQTLLEDCRYIGSYDWSPDAKKGNPVIVVPGSPNVWVDPILPLQVLPDKGTHIRDNNNHILTGQPLLPLLAAVDQQQIFARKLWKTVDFVTDRNGLRKLLRWVMKESGRDFRIDTQLVGNKTIVLNRREISTTERMNGDSFGFNFEKAATVPMPPATNRSAWHHRIITYMFGRFRMVVQFEVDGCLLPQDWLHDVITEEDSLADAMENLGISASSATSTNQGAAQETSRAFGLTVHHRGRADIPHSSIVEMTTRSSRSSGRFPWNNRYPQLHFSQTGNHHTAMHQNGEFCQINKLTLSSPELQKVHQRLQPAMEKLEAALGQIQSIVKEHGDQERLSLVYQQRTLTVHKNLSNFSCFPQEALRLFD